MIIDKTIQELSSNGIKNILKAKEWIKLNNWGEDTRLELEQISQCNVNEELIDIIEFIIELDCE
jgi:hypothetical protein